MKLGELHRPRGSRKTAKRLGQGVGSGTGKTAGKGHKGQRARSGANRGGRRGFEGGQMPLHRRLPKIGFSNHRFKKVYQMVNVGDLEARGLEGEVGPEQLVSTGLVRKTSVPIKVLGDGEIKRALTVRAHAFSRSAIEKIQSAGGTAVTLDK